jgi:hypothetical protein
MGILNKYHRDVASMGVVAGTLAILGEIPLQMLIFPPRIWGQGPYIIAKK